QHPTPRFIEMIRYQAQKICRIVCIPAHGDGLGVYTIDALAPIHFGLEILMPRPQDLAPTYDQVIEKILRERVEKHENKDHLTPIDESIFKTISAGKFASRELYRLRLWAEYAQLVSGFDELICLDQLSFTPFDYQTRAAQIMLRRFRGRGMFCDEVGLGKTIEAGLVIKEYLARNIVQRLMVVTPASLVEQWREELAVKFGLTRFVTTADAEFRLAGSEAWEKFPLLIASSVSAPTNGRGLTTGG
ncbi:MAG: SNF2-related protein, partial [Chloroflexota bacterium]